MLRCLICLLFLSEDLFVKDRMVLCVDSTNTTTFAADITTYENGGNCSISRLLLLLILLLTKMVVIVLFRDFYCFISFFFF
jgi:hypothetical protein